MSIRIRTAAPASRFAAAFADSDSEEEHEAAPVVPVAPYDYETDPIYQALKRGDILWGDLFVEPAPAPVPVPDGFQVAGRRRAPAAAATPAPETTPMDLYCQPFASRLEQHTGSVYDTSEMSDRDWAACMTWLYANGWSVHGESRAGFQADPDTLPPRVWVSPAPPAPLCAAGSDTGRRRAAPRPIFCSGGPKCTDGCPYVHGDSIPVLNMPCQFGCGCGKRVVGVGATPCIRLHPDEEWTPTMVRNRPVATPSPPS
jgi:hypothetical protein